MGASAGTGIRSFAEGGSTSAPTGGTGFGRINPAAIRADPRAFGIGPAAESLRQDLAREQALPRQIYQPQYEDYGLGSTPQAQGQLAALLNMGSYGNQMPTFTRPQAPPPQAQYSIPYRTTPDSSFQGLLTNFNKTSPFRKSLTPEQRSENLIRDYRENNLTEAAYNNLMQNPGMSLDFIRRVDAGENPTTIGYASPPPIQYMTAAQQKAYNDKISGELSEILTPRTVFEVQDYGGGG